MGLFPCQVKNVIMLQLTLKKKWFEMILSGQKAEEYREIKEYWIKRLFVNHREYFTLLKNKEMKHCRYKTVKFRLGYSRNAPNMIFEIASIAVGTPNPEWSEECNDDVFIIHLGNRIL